MKKLFVLVFFLASCSSARLIKKEIGETENQLHEHIGVYVVDVSSNKVLIEHNASKYFTPASNTKIFTLYTSLRLLGDSIPALKYIQRNDSIIFQGLGDASFLYKDVFDNGRTFQFLKNQSSKLFFSSNNFQAQQLGAGWAWDDYNDYYSAERSAFPLYGNLISIKKQNEKLNFQPAFFENDFHTSPDVHASTEIIRDVHSNHLTYFDGKKKRNEWTIPFHTNDSLTTKLLSDTLHRSVEKIHWKDFSNAKVLKSIPSDSLYTVMMKASDNFIAEQLLLQCAVLISDTLKTEIAINYSTKNFLNDLPDAPQWADGSGLSHYNLFTPRTIVSLWKKLHDTIPQNRLFKIVAVGGQNGTLKNFYKAEAPYLFGKTGSLGNVVTLSGFLITKKGKTFVFSVMNNNFVSSSNDVRKRIEKILNELREKY